MSLFQKSDTLLMSLLILSLVLAGSVRGQNRERDTEEDYDDDDDEEQDDPTGRVSLGSFEVYAHELRGDLKLVDDKTLEISGLSYDGLGPAAWFMVGKTSRSSLPEIIELEGTVIPDENESCDTLKLYRQDDITLKLPGKMTFSDYNYISMYCLRFNHNFGYVMIPDDVKLKNGTSSLKACDPDDIADAEEDSRPAEGPRPPPSQQAQPSGGGLLSGLINRVTGILG